MAVPTGNRNTSVLLLEQIGPSEARIGVPYTYQIRVTNLTNMAVTGIVLKQHLPADFKLSSRATPDGATKNPSTQPATLGESHTRFEIGDLSAGESKTVRVTGTPTRAGAIDTRLSVQYNPPELYAHVSVVAPQLSIAAQGPAQADICQEIVCRYLITNVGSGTAHGVTLHETLPEGLFSAETETSISAPLGDLAPGESKDFTAHLRAVRSGKYATKATVAGTDTPQVHSEQLVTSIVSPSLAISITGPRESYFGQPLTFQISVTNRGDMPAARARFAGNLSGPRRLVNVTSAEGTTLPAIAESNEQDLGVIPAGQTRKFMAHFLPKEGGALTTDVTVLANCAEPVAASASSRIVTVAAPSLTVSHDPDPVPTGSNVTYHITVQNKGTAEDENVSVSATLPTSAQLVHAGGGTEAKSDGLNITFAPISVLQPGKSVTWQVEAKALRATMRSSWRL